MMIYTSKGLFYGQTVSWKKTPPV